MTTAGSCSSQPPEIDRRYKRRPEGLEVLSAAIGVVIAGLLAVALLGCSEEGGEADWPQWRGPGGLGVSTGSPLPTTWGPGSSNVKWQIELEGWGLSSPVVSRGRVFLTAFHEGSGAQVLGFDLDTGKKLWQTGVKGKLGPRKTSMHALAGPTPAADGRRLFAHLGFKLVSLDYRGRVKWEQLLEPAPDEQAWRGAFASPVLSRDRVFVMRDNEHGDRGVGWVGAFDKRTGREVWRDEWTHNCCSYTTPLLIEREARQELVTSRPGEIVSYDAETGSQLWRYGHRFSGVFFPSLAAAGDVIVTAGGSTNAETVALRLSGSGRETGKQALWKEVQAQPRRASPVVYEGLLFTITDEGVMTCLDLLTGEVKWRESLPSTGFYASLAAGDGKVYALDRQGTTIVVAARDEFELLAENDLFPEEEAYPNVDVIASPALARGGLVIRSRGHLFRIAGEGSGPSGSAGESADLEMDTGPDGSRQDVGSGAPPVDDVEATLLAWAEAWSRQDVRAYLSYYSDSFRTPPGMSRKTWEAGRRRRLRKPKYIEVQLSDLRRLDVAGEPSSLPPREKAAVAFTQTYRSDSFSDQVGKVVELEKVGDHWRIVAEESRALEAP